MNVPLHANPDSILDAIRDVLRDAGDPAVEMLKGNHPLNGTILFTALSAAGNLNDRTVTADLVTTRTRLTYLALEYIDVIDAIDAEADFRAGFVYTSDKFGALQQILRSAGLANALPDSKMRKRIEQALTCEWSEIAAAHQPNSLVTNTAQRLLVELQLEDGHPVRPILELMQSASFR